tara:strand:- start:4043 stop:6916 length:2874 start_codon:yes stop_codon:yes gene_type:complete
MAGKVFSVTAILGVNSKKMAIGLKKASAKMIAWARTTMARVGRLIKAGMLIAGAAVAYFAYKSIREFSKFEEGMNEVFTLVPGMSQKAMGAMGDDALKLAKKMGVLPEEVVPALYQALSAGVPPGNVFQFMESAIKASKAGVVDMKTAVDALTTVTNTYGISNLSSARAADLMFATVKAGKTTFGELASTLYNVLPIAEAAGIGFEQISAATAAMTLKGVPTAQVMTQLKAAIQSIIAPSTRSAKWFAKYGLNVKELGKVMAGPGGLVKAMNMIKTATNGDMQAMRKLLGSVEAISAVLTLTSDGGNKFNEVLNDMTNNTGQANAAFRQMDQGLARSFEKMHASLKVAMIKFGKALAPLIHQITPIFTRIINGIDSINWAKIINGFARVWHIGLKPTFQAVMRAIYSMPWIDLWNFLLPIASLIIKTIQKIGVIIVGLTPMIVPLMEVLAGYFTLLHTKFFLLVHFLSKIAPQIGAVFKDVFEVMSAAIGFLINPSAEKFDWLIRFIIEKYRGLPAIVGALFRRVWVVMQETLNLIVGGVASAFTMLVKSIWDKFGVLLSSIPGFTEALDGLKRAFAEVKHAIIGEIMAMIAAYEEMTGAVGDNVEGTHWWQKASEYLGKSLGQIIVLTIKFITALVYLVGMLEKVRIRLMTELAPALKELLPLAFKVAAAFIYFFIEGLKATIWMITQVIKAVVFLEPVFMQMVSIVSGFVLAVVEGVKAIWEVFKWLYFQIRDGIGWAFEVWTQAFYDIKAMISNTIDNIIGLFKKLKDFVYWVLFGGTITKDFKKAFDYIEKIVMGVLGAIFDIFDKFEDICDKHLKVVLRIFETVFGGILQIVNKIGDTLTSVFSSMENMVLSLLKAFTNMGKAIGRIFDKVLALGGKAMALAGKAAGAVGGAVGGALSFVGLGGVNKPKGVRPQVSGANVSSNLKQITKQIDALERRLIQINTSLKGKFTNQ